MCVWVFKSNNVCMGGGGYNSCNMNPKHGVPNKLPLVTIFNF